MTSLDYTLMRIDRLLRLRGYAQLTRQEREMIDDLLDTTHYTDADLVNTVCLARYYEGVES